MKVHEFARSLGREVADLRSNSTIPDFHVAHVPARFHWLLHNPGNATKQWRFMGTRILIWNVRFRGDCRPRPRMSDHFDGINIGTGAGGGTLAYRLAPSGKHSLLIERGPYVPREKDNWSTKAVNQDGKYNTKEVWRDKVGKDLHPHTN